VDIATGAAQDHPTPLPLDPQAPVAPVTAAYGQVGGQGGVFDAAADQEHRLSAAAGDVAAAQHAGMTAETGRRERYAQDMLPQGALYGDEMALPVVADNSLPAASSDLYPWPGQEPVPAAADVDGYGA
jgi:hypothetical protein